MPRKLITILGKARKKDGGDYTSARYDFGDGREPIETKYLGLALQQRLQSDTLIVLGTSGSMWDNLFDSLGLYDSHPGAMGELIDAAQNDAVTDAQLAPLAQAASSVLGKTVICETIPYGRDEAEQIAIISQILGYFGKGDRAILDITHGLRHLPLLIEHIANLLPTLKDVAIENIYYGAYELARDNKTSVLSLAGLQKISDWQNALAAYDHSGNIAVFAPILTAIGVSANTVKLLESAAYAEQTHRFRQSKQLVENFLAELKKEPDSELLNLIRPTLADRLNWIKHPQHRFILAEQALAHKDYLRAALYGFEAFYDRILEHQHYDENYDYETRKAIIDEYLARVRDNRKGGAGEANNQKINTAYDKLRAIRNALAHGSDPNDASEKRLAEIKSILGNEDKLAQTLHDALQILKNTTL